MFIWTFFNGAYANINAPLIRSIAEVQGFTNEIMVNYIATITNLAMVAANIFLLLIGGKKMNMRIWAVVAGVLTIGGSVGAVLVSGSLSAMIFMRFFVGFGAGFGCLISGAVLPFYFEGKELATVLGVVTAASIMPLASFIGRALNGPIYNKIGRFFLHLFYGMLLAGLILGVVATTFNLSLVAIFLVGATMGLAHPVVTLLAIKTSPKAQVRAQAMILAGENIGKVLDLFIH